MSLMRSSCSVRRVALVALLLIAGTLIGMLSIRGSAQEESARPDRHGALVLVPMRPQRILDDAAAAALTQADAERQRQTQIQLARSRVVLNAALRTPELAKLPVIQKQVEPLDFVEDNLDISFVDKSDLMRIAFRAGSAEEKAAIANAVAKAYVEDAIRRDAEPRTQRLSKLTEVHEELDTRLQQKRRIVRQLADEIGGHKPARREFDEELARKNLRSVQDELVQLETQVRQLRFDLAERELEGAKPDKDKVATEAALQKLERRRTFLFAERDQHLKVLETGRKQVDVQFLADEIELERALLVRIQSQRQALQFEMQAPSRFALVQEATAR
jgi:hypothetical protein